MLKNFSQIANKMDSNGDVYSGNITTEVGLGTVTNYFYILSFEPGTQARGHVIADFKLYQMLDGGKLIFIDKSNFVSEILKEVLKGF